MARPLLRSALLLPPCGAALALAIVAIHLQPPAADVSRNCVGIAAGLLLVNLIAWVARDGEGFGREERLWVFVVFAGVAGGYYTARQAIVEREFDDMVQLQQRALASDAAQLSNEILAFVEGRVRLAPPKPAPATWEHDEASWLVFERQTVDEYNHRFARRVRKARADFTFRSLRDRDLDTFYQSPANPFQIRMVGERLAAMALRLRRVYGEAD